MALEFVELNFFSIYKWVAFKCKFFAFVLMGLAVLLGVLFSNLFGDLDGLEFPSTSILDRPYLFDAMVDDGFSFLAFLIKSTYLRIHL